MLIHTWVTTDKNAVRPPLPPTKSRTIAAMRLRHPRRLLAQQILSVVMARRFLAATIPVWTGSPCAHARVRRSPLSRSGSHLLVRLFARHTLAIYLDELC